jgi:hypothetical protein
VQVTASADIPPGHYRLVLAFDEQHGAHLGCRKRHLASGRSRAQLQRSLQSRWPRADHVESRRLSCDLGSDPKHARSGRPLDAGTPAFTLGAARRQAPAARKSSAPMTDGKCS